MRTSVGFAGLVAAAGLAVALLVLKAPYAWSVAVFPFVAAGWIGVLQGRRGL